MKKKILVILGGLLIAIILFVSAYYLIDSYKIKKIDIDGVSELNGAYSLKDTNILFLDTNSTVQMLLKRNPLSKKIDIYKKYPNTLSIVVQQSSPFVSIKMNDGYMILSREATIMNFSKTNSQLPIITYYQQFKEGEFNLGDRLSFKDIESSIYFLDKMNSLGFVIETVDINSLNVIVLKNGEKTYIFSSDKDKELQYQTVKTILEYFKKENKDYKSIDLRFDKPVIRI